MNTTITSTSTTTTTSPVAAATCAARPRVLVARPGARGPLLAASDSDILPRFVDERNRDLRALARHIIRNTPEPLTQMEVAALTVAHTAPAYYVDYDYAVHVIPRVLRLPAPQAATAGRGKWMEIATRAREAMAAGEASSLSAAIAIILGRGRASRFFLSVASARRIIFGDR